ncbi:MAG: hypothetical protein HY328_03340 [Chloroflexi bacterium]|nr:hypothetical protein [Chloroflexota bacterium]
MNASFGAQVHPHKPSFPKYPLSWALVGARRVVALILFVLAAGAAQAQTGGPVIYLDPPQTVAGAIILVNGYGFGQGSGDLTFFWDGEKIATHPLESVEGFSIPFPVPAEANPGDHRIDVCAGEPCATEQRIRATALLSVVTAFPHFTESVAYIYDTDKRQADEFDSLLGRVGIGVVPIPLADVTQTDWSKFKLVIVGSDTGDGRQWGNDEKVAALKKAARIVGMGKGGHAFLGKLGLLIGAPNGTQLQAHKISAGDPQLTSLRVPYDLTALVRNQREMSLFEKPVDTVAIDLSSQPAALLPHALLDGANRVSDAGLIVGQGCRTLWGFGGAPNQMTPLGQSLFVNLIVFALGNRCDVTLTVPCGPLVNQATIPGYVFIDFDDREKGAEIADFYANSHGVRFEQSSTNRAVIYAGHPEDPSQPRSAPNVAFNDASGGNSEGVPLPIFFERDQSHVGMWIGNGEGIDGKPANLAALLTAYDRRGKELCSARLTPVSVSHTSFLGLTDAYGRIAYIKLDYGRAANAESIDDLVFGPFAPANNIRVCTQQAQTACIPAAGTEVVILRNGSAVGPPAKTDSQGYVVPRSRVAFGDLLWAKVTISETQQSTLLHTSGAPRRVQPVEFNGFPGAVMTLSVGPSNPLLLYNLTFSTQWSLLGDAVYQARLRSHIQKAANYLYDFSDGQMSLGDIHIYQNYDMWDEADVRIYASNHLRPLAEIGGVSVTEMVDPLLANISYYPGHTFMGRTWNRFHLPGEPTYLGVDISNDWPLALAHELGHYLLYLFDTYLAVTAEGEIVETDSCTGSAMGWVYEEANTEFVFDPAHWKIACGDTLANHTLKRNEWETILLWYSSLLAPTVVNPGPSAPPVSFVNATIHPPSNPALVLPSQTFTLTYQAGETASGEARAFLMRNNRIIDQGKPDEGTTQITLIGAQTNDRFCVFDVNDFADDSSSPRHHYGCEILEVGDNTLQMKKDDAWAPIIQISHAASHTVGISVTQEIGAGLSMRAILYPEDTNTPTEIVLAADGNLHTGTFHSPVDATSAYVQVYVDEASSETNPRRETLVDYGVGGGGAEGPATWFGGVPVISSDGKAEFARTSDIFLATGEFIALQSMAGTPQPPAGRQIVGQAYRLVALPRTLADEGHVTLRIRPLLGNDRRAQALPKVVVAFWDGTVWTPIKSINLDDLVNGRIAIAPTRGVGVYALLLEEETPPASRIYLPEIKR